MELTGEYRIPAPRRAVWNGLNDAAVLRDCIDGCESLEKRSESEFKGSIKARIGPVKTVFGGTLTLSDMRPPDYCAIQVQGEGRAAGFAKGSADIHLSEDGDGTLVRYAARADVGGKLAQMGSRLVKGAARKTADDFFEKFADRIATSDVRPEDTAPVEPEVQVPPPEPEVIAEPAKAGQPRGGAPSAPMIAATTVLWIAILVLIFGS